MLGNPLLKNLLTQIQQGNTNTTKRQTCNLAKQIQIDNKKVSGERVVQINFGQVAGGRWQLEGVSE